jgi:glutamine amidotransferase
MCRLFGFRSAVGSKAHRSLVEAENALGKQASMHPHGWGIGYFVDQDAYILKSDDAAHTSERFKLASSRLRSHTLVAHVRKATVGGTDYLNSHPFRFGRWVFAHNGTVFDFDEHFKQWMLEQIPEPRRNLILGTTDSEHTFHYLLSALTEAGFDPKGHINPDCSVAAEVLQKAVDRIYERSREVGTSDWPILNFILTNGDVFFAQRAGKGLWFATQKHACGDFNICPVKSKVCMEAARPDAPVNHLIITSERIGEEDRWESLEQGQMVWLDADWNVGFSKQLDEFELSKLAE